MDVLPAGAHVVILDAPDETLVNLAQQLAEYEVQLSVIHRQSDGTAFPDSHFAIDPVLTGDALDGEIKAALKTLGEAHEGIDVFLSFSTDPLVNFLFAKHINRWYRQSSHPARKVCMIITHLDGQLGTSGAGDWQLETGAIFGLVKTLAQEWPQVFCRAVDFAPNLSMIEENQVLLQELQDVNTRLAEIGWRDGQRWTIGLETQDGEIQ